MSNAIITLTTDFGAGSHYVAAMKGVILGINPAAQVVDITHAIGPQNIDEGSIVLAETAPTFPRGTIHVAVVDPGVGSARSILYAEIAGHRYICPDNGLLTRLAAQQMPSKIRCISEPQWFRRPVAVTFHGRDIMAPVAAHLSLGIDPDLLGPAPTDFVRLQLASASMADNRIKGEVTAVDSFGNLITNITREMISHAPTDDTVGIYCDEHETRGIFQTYSDQPPMTLIALVGSNDCLELAIVQDSAAAMLGIGVGAPVEMRW